MACSAPVTVRATSSPSAVRLSSTLPYRWMSGESSRRTKICFTSAPQRLRLLLPQDSPGIQDRDFVGNRFDFVQQVRAVEDGPPLALRCVIRSRLNCFLMIGSSPNAGSSRITSSGRCASAKTRPSRTDCPFERCFTFVCSGRSNSFRYR